MNQPQEKPALYSEEQRFSQPWVVLPLVTITVILSLVVWNGLYQQLVEGKPWGKRPMPDEVLSVVGPLILVFLWGVFWLFMELRLTTKVYEDYVLIHFFPLYKKLVKMSEIKTCNAVTYRPIRDFGGWGIRLRWGETAYTVSGDRGVRLELLNGKKILIGSNTPEKLAMIINKQLDILSRKNRVDF